MVRRVVCVRERERGGEREVGRESEKKKLHTSSNRWQMNCSNPDKAIIIIIVAPPFTDSDAMLLHIIPAALFATHCTNISLTICFLFYFQVSFSSEAIIFSWLRTAAADPTNRIVYNPRYLVCYEIHSPHLSAEWVEEERKNGYR